jgi:dimethylamine/trimethylamine dehydrogenase
VVSNCVYTGSQQNFDCDSVVMVASQASEDALCVDLLARQAQWSDAGIRTVRAFGDAEAPGPIAWATYAGHRYARELDEPDIGDDLPFRREIAELAAD